MKNVAAYLDIRPFPSAREAALRKAFNLGKGVVAGGDVQQQRGGMKKKKKQQKRLEEEEEEEEGQTNASICMDAQGEDREEDVSPFCLALPFF